MVAGKVTHMLTSIIVIKKNGDKETFEPEKMVHALEAASHDTNKDLSEDEKKNLEKAIYEHIDSHQILTPQDMHILAMKIARDIGRNDVADEYLRYHKHKQKLKSHDLEDLKVVKQDGSVEDFNFEHIFEAIDKAAAHVDEPVTDIEKEQIKDAIAHYAEGYVDVVSSESVHRLVMGALKIVRPDIFEVYRSYHNARKEEAKLFKDMFDESENIKYGSYNENANKDSQVITTKSALITEVAMKKFMRNTLPKKWIKAHDEGWIYMHDLSDLYKDTFNCDLFDLRHLLENKEHEDGVYAFKINNKITYQPKHVSSAFDIMSSVTIAASGNQFGVIALLIL